MAKVSIDQMSAEISELLQDYASGVTNDAETIIRKVSKDAADMLKENSPKRTGKYRSGWTVTLEKSRLGIKATVWNKNKPGLVHLLEHGHMKQNGKYQPAQPHVAPVADWVETTFSEEFVKAVEARN